MEEEEEEEEEEVVVGSRRGEGERMRRRGTREMGEEGEECLHIQSSFNTG